MASVQRYLIIIVIALLTLCEGSRWREFLSKKKIILLSNKGGRVAGGTEAARNQFPYAVLFFTSHLDETESACSGSIISSLHVLSAAHCFSNMTFSDLLAGIHDVTLEYPLYELQITSADVLNHPNFNNPPRSNDIALVSTRRSPLTFSHPSIQPIVLAPRSYVNVNLTGFIARVAGWGLTSNNGEMSPVPRFIDSPIISNQDCMRTFGNLILSSNFCLSGASRSTCSGDSGGGATINVGNTPRLFGIISFGSQFGCQSGYPTVKTRITSYLDWISTNAGITIT